MYKQKESSSNSYKRCAAAGTKKKKRCKNAQEDNFNSYVNSERVLTALDERIKDIESRGRSRKKRKNTTVKPVWKRAASTPSTMSSSYPKGQGMDHQSKSVRFQNHPASCHVPMVDVSPPPCQGRDCHRGAISGDGPHKNCARSQSTHNFAGSGEIANQGGKAYNPASSSSFTPDGYSRSGNNNYGHSVPPNNVYGADSEPDFYSYKGMFTDEMKKSDLKNWKLALKMDEFMQKYSEFDRPKSKNFPAAAATKFPGNFLDAKNAYGLTSKKSLPWEQKVSPVQTKRFTSPYKGGDYNSQGFSKYSNFYGDNSISKNPAVSLSSNYSNVYGMEKYRPDAIKSYGENRNAHSTIDLPISGNSDWMNTTSSYFGDPGDRGFRKDSSLSSKWDFNKTPFPTSTYGLDKTNNRFSFPSKSSTLFSDDMKLLGGASQLYDSGLAKLKREIFGTSILNPQTMNEAPLVSAMVSEYKRMDYYRKTLQSQREKNLELMEKYVFGKSKESDAEYLYSANDGRNKFSPYHGRSSSIDKATPLRRNSSATRYGTADVSLPLNMADKFDKYRNMNYSSSSNTLKTLDMFPARSRSLSGRAADHPYKPISVKSVCDTSFDLDSSKFLNYSSDSRWRSRSRYLNQARGSSADNAKALHVQPGEASDQSWKRSKTPDDYLYNSHASCFNKDSGGRRSPSMDRDVIRQGYMILKKFGDRYGDKRNRSFSPVNRKSYLNDLTALDRTPNRYSSGGAQDQKVKSSVGENLSSDYVPLDFQRNYTNYGTKSDTYAYSNSYGDGIGGTRRSPIKNSNPKKEMKRDFLDNPSSYLNSRTQMDFSANAKTSDQSTPQRGQLGTSAQKGVDLSEHELSNSSNNAPSKDSSGVSVSRSRSGQLKGATGGAQNSLKDFTSKYVIDWCLDDETNRLRSIDSLISKTARDNCKHYTIKRSFDEPDQSKQS